MNIKSIVDRLKEPSTYAGLAGLALVIGMEAQEFQGYVNAVAGALGFISILLKEGKV